MDYYLDESGSTGDLVNKKLTLDFSNQPIFTHACIGFDIEEKISFSEFFETLKSKFHFTEELKSQDIYYKIPEFTYELSKYMKENVVKFFCEVIDKKYNIAVAIVNHLIVPASNSEKDGKNQYIRNILADYLTQHGTPEVFENFMKLCLVPSEDNLFCSFDTLKIFFKSKPVPLPDEGLTVLMIEETLDDYKIAKSKLGVTKAISFFMPIPDFDNNNNIISLTPHVHCFYNILGRLNKYHVKRISHITLHHDEQKEYSSSMSYCLEKLKGISADNFPIIPNADFDFEEFPELLFIDSSKSIEIQACDILSGFMNRFINGVFYKNLDVENIYKETFNNLVHYNRFPQSPLGTNFVLPVTVQNMVFGRFNL